MIMKVTILPGRITGEISAIPSKSHLHRLLIYAAFANNDTLISCRDTEAEDIFATIECLSALGAVIGRNEDGFAVTPIERDSLKAASDKTFAFPCGESGSTLRFMLPIVCALGIRGAFEMKGRLPERPLAPLDAQLHNHGIRLWRDKPSVLNCEGQLQHGNDYNIPGDISSQFISGLLMGLSLLKKPSRLTVSGTTESAGYIELTLETAEAFGKKPEVSKSYYDNELNTCFDTRGNTVYIVGGEGDFKSPGYVETEGDWSNGAFWLCAGAMPRGNIRLTGLRKDSIQGDREIYLILSKMGAGISWENEGIRVKEDKRHSMEIDCTQIPDLVPVLAAVACVGSGLTTFQNASRLRIKESDRLTATAKTLSALGANICETSDKLMVEGVPILRGGTVDAHGDHRIAMMAAIASAACTQLITVTGAQAVNKSYPNFWKDLALLGKKVIEE